MRSLVALAVAALAACWFATGIMMVDTGKMAVVYRFGAIVRTAPSGLRVRLPRPLEWDERLNLTEVRRVAPESRRFLTGDHNLVQLALVVQYTVSDPVAFSVTLADPEAVIAPEVLGAAARAAAGMEVDDLLTTGRTNLQHEVLTQAQAALDGLHAGVRLVAVDVQELSPPQPVVDAFNDVSSARGDRETLALAAEAYASKLIPDVRGQAASSVEQARGQASETLARARGEVERFRVVHGAWVEDQEGTRVDLRAALEEAVAPHLEVVASPRGAEIVLPNGMGGRP